MYYSLLTVCGNVSAFILSWLGIYSITCAKAKLVKFILIHMISNIGHTNCTHICSRRAWSRPQERLSKPRKGSSKVVRTPFAHCDTYGTYTHINQSINHIGKAYMLFLPPWPPVSSSHAG